jgi:hypothetical protein
MNSATGVPSRIVYREENRRERQRADVDVRTHVRHTSRFGGRKPNDETSAV